MTWAEIDWLQKGVLKPNQEQKQRPRRCRVRTARVTKFDRRLLHEHVIATTPHLRLDRCSSVSGLSTRRSPRSTPVSSRRTNVQRRLLDASPSAAPSAMQDHSVCDETLCNLKGPVRGDLPCRKLPQSSAAWTKSTKQDRRFLMTQRRRDHRRQAAYPTTRTKHRRRNLPVLNWGITAKQRNRAQHALNGTLPAKRRDASAMSRGGDAALSRPARSRPLSSAVPLMRRLSDVTWFKSSLRNSCVMPRRGVFWNGRGLSRRFPQHKTPSSWERGRA